MKTLLQQPNTGTFHGSRLNLRCTSSIRRTLVAVFIVFSARNDFWKSFCKQSWRTCQPVGPYWILRSPSARYLMKIRKNSYLNCITVSFIVDLSVGLATLNIFQHCSPGVTDFVWRSLKLIIIIVIEHNLNSNFNCTTNRPLLGNKMDSVSVYTQAYVLLN